MKNKFLNDILKHKNPQIAENSKRFFKTQKGEYSEHDIFLGVQAPLLRKIAKIYFKELNIEDFSILITNKYHEVRACALMALILKYKKANNEQSRRQIFQFYMANTKYINNWDLVDISASNIIGHYLFNYNKTNSQQVLLSLANQESLWAQRIAIVATHYFIKQNKYDTTLALSKKLLNHKHDLMHKAIGWMLREVGKQNKDILVNLLETNINIMPRTTLRYAIEKFNENERKTFLLK